MVRLKTLPSLLSPLPPALNYVDAPSRSAEANRSTFAPWRKWYGTARWQKLRMKILKRDMFTCQCGCGVLEADTSLLVADHRTPHRGDPALFWDEDNLWTLRKSPCHDKHKQIEERAGR